MSDESQPPQLRLRSRKRDDEPPAPPAAASLPPDVPAAAAPASEPSARFRLKPKLSIDAQPQADAAAAEAAPAPVIPHAAPVPQAPIASEQNLSALGQASESAGTPKLKLKQVLPSVGSPLAAAPGPEPVSAPVPPPPVPAIIPAIVPAPPPGVVPPPTMAFPPAVPMNMAPPALVGALPPVVVKAPLRTAPSGFKPVAIPAPPPPKLARKPGRKRVVVVVSLLIAVPVVLGVAAYFTFSKHEEVSPAPSSSGTASAGAPASPNAGVEPRPIGSSSAASNIEPLPPQPSANQGGIARTPKPATQVSSATAAAFKAWVDEARITGVVVGDSPRAIINNRLVRPGDLIDASQGIVFDSLDMTRKEVVFRNGAGLYAGKPY